MELIRRWVRRFVTGRITVMVVPHAARDIRSYRVPVGAVYGALFLVLAGSFVTGNALLRTAELGRARRDATRLAGENILLAGELGRVEERLTGLGEEIVTLTAFGERMRTVADLVPIDEDVRQVGVGGPAVGGLARSLTGRGAPSARIPKLDAARSEAATLSRQARLLRESFSEVMETLTERKEELAHTPSILPLENCWVTNGFGYRADPFTGERKMHCGVDLSARRGEPIVASAAGKVKLAARKGHLGLTVEIDHGNGIVTRYGHAERVFVKRGQQVVRGQVVAAVGSSGRSTNPHLHYEVRLDGRPVNPFRYIVR